MQAEWYSIYKAVLLEPDPARLSARINEAETAIFSRIQNLTQDSDSAREREIMENALGRLRALQRNLASFP